MRRDFALIAPDKLEAHIERRTELSQFIAKDLIQNVADYKKDKNQTKRLKDKECKKCFLLGKWAIWRSGDNEFHM